ncbi:unnamed protein product [Toxocara canis]|uniref:PG_binding_1 domain-containing protein n=1 Tax=Toxocara canis TaxID=6265 RepID=A0A183VG17_TOXCA|nr:unnamed protein product [Toxocara canis]
MLKHLTFVCILHETFVHSCFSTSGASSRYDQIYQFRRIPAKFGTKINIDDDAKQYLETFGYLRPTRTVSDAPTNDVPITSRQLKNAVAKFQKLIGIPQSGVLDDTTREAMLLKRCARKDLADETNYVRGKNLLWNKLNLSWNISSFPSSLPKSRTREAFEKMFEVWRTHGLFDFIEVGDKNKADIAITFDPASSRWPPDRTSKLTFMLYSDCSSALNRIVGNPVEPRAMKIESFDETL